MTRSATPRAALALPPLPAGSPTASRWQPTGRSWAGGMTTITRSPTSRAARALPLLLPGGLFTASRWQPTDRLRAGGRTTRAWSATPRMARALPPLPGGLFTALPLKPTGLHRVCKLPNKYPEKYWGQTLFTTGVPHEKAHNNFTILSVAD